MPTVIAAGHICLDLIPHIPSAETALKPGALIHVGAATLATGGSVANSGLALHRLGVHTRLVACVGDDLFATAVRNLLAAQGADAGHLLTLPDQPTSYSVVINPPGIDRTFLHCPGANDAFDPGRLTADTLRGARLLHFGYPQIMQSIYADGGEKLASLFQRARSLGLATSLDTAFPDPASDAGRADWPTFFQTVLPHTDLFLPSADELAAMLRQPEGDAADLPALRAMSDRLLAMGAPVVLIKLGSRGLYARVSPDADRLARMPKDLAPSLTPFAGRELLAPCFQVDVAGTTGAGDTTVAGVLAALLRGDPLPAAMTFAVAVGACCVERPDATSGIPPADTVRARIAAGWQRHPPHANLNGWHNDHGTFTSPQARP